MKLTTPSQYIKTMKMLFLLTGFYLVFNQDSIGKIPLPPGYKRIALKAVSFGKYLRDLKLNKDNTVYLFNGKKKENQELHFAVIAIDVGKQNLQQCADAVIRLRAEYLYKSDLANSLAFNFTSGDRFYYHKFLKGFYPKVNGNKVAFIQTARKENNYQTFRNYLSILFTYAGTYSLKKESDKVYESETVEIGNFFIQGAFPGHAMIIVDLAENQNGEKIFMLAQSYMPAQSIHIVNNPENRDLSPWYTLKNKGKLHTPEWTFYWSDLYRFRD